MGRITLQDEPEFDYSKGIKFMIKRANNLRAMDVSNYSSDPFMKIFVLGQNGRIIKKFKSAIFYANKNPQFEYKVNM